MEFGPGACVHAGANTFGVSYRYRRIRLTDVLGRSPATDVLDVRYHRSPDDTCEAGPAPIISNPGDNHAPGGISTSRTPKMGVRTPILGVPGALRAPAGGARTPGGGQKLSPPGDGRHLTDFVAN